MRFLSMLALAGWCYVLSYKGALVEDHWLRSFHNCLRYLRNDLAGHLAAREREQTGQAGHTL